MKGSHTPSVVFLLILLAYSAMSTMGQDSPNVTNIDDSEIQVMRRVAGDNVRFDCNVSNVHQAIWRRDEPLKLLFAGLNPTGNDNGNIHISKDNYSLILDRVDQEDEGNYTCIEYGNNTKAQYQLLVTEFSPCTEEGRNYCEDCCTPDVIQKDLKKIEETEVNEDNVDQVADELQQVSSHIEHVDPHELKSIVHSLTNIVHTTTSEEKVTEVTDSVLNIASNIMEVENKVTDQVSDVGNVPHLLEQQAATIHSKQKNYSQVLDNVGFSAVQISQSALKKDVTFESFSDDNSLKHENPPLSKNNTGLHYDKPSSNVVSAITLPSSILEIIDNAASNTTTVPLSFLVYRDASIFPVKESSNQSNESRTVISSHVISATVAIENVEIKDLPDDSQVGTTFYSFPISRSEEEVEEKRECVFWKYNKTDGSGEWSTDGCRKVEDSSEKRQIKCLCNHLTSFAILVHVRLVYTPPPLYVDVIFKIGCVLSIVGLSLCIVTALTVKSIRSKQQSQIHLNLCIALVGLYLTFLIGIDRTENSLGCKSTSSLIHYFALSSMAWMSVEAFNMFLLFWMMKRSQIRHLIPVSMVVAWGGPFVAAAFVFFFDKSNNIERRVAYCFLHPGYGLYFGFLLLVGLLFLFNCVVFVLITYKVTCRKILATNEEAKKKERIARLRGTFLFWVLLGMSWAFGFLSIIIPPLRIVFEVLFAFCLTLQGVCMFYMIVIKNPEIKRGVTKMTSAAMTSMSESGPMKKWRYVPVDNFIAYFQTSRKDTSAVSSSVAETSRENKKKENDTPEVIS